MPEFEGLEFEEVVKVARGVLDPSLSAAQRDLLSTLIDAALAEGEHRVATVIGRMFTKLDAAEPDVEPHDV